MNGKVTVSLKMTVDFAATIFLLAAMGFRITGPTIHEIIGAVVLALLVAHNVLNRKWYGSLLKGRYGLFRIVNTAFIGLLILSLLALFATGMMTSRLLFPLVTNPDGMVVRQLHVLSAYWSFVLSSVHLGIHWNRVMAFVRKRIGNPKPIWTGTVMLRLAAMAFFLYGAKVFVDREIWAKLIMYYSFEFWDSSEHAFWFFTAYLSLLSAGIFLGHYGMKPLQRFTSAKRED